MNKRFITVTAILCFIFQTGQAQKQSSADSLFTRQFAKSFRFPRDIAEECKSSFVSVLVKISGRKVQGFEFSKNARQSLRDEFGKLKPLFESTKWEQIYPATGKQKEFNVYIPLVYYYFQNEDCKENITFQLFGSLFEAAFDWEAEKKEAVFLHKPVIYQISKPVR
jgi:hypothetical protein